jgi:AbiV family abortive infection protein
MARRRRQEAAKWPEDFTARKRLAAEFGVAAAQNALAFLEQARILSEVEVLELDESESDESDEESGALEADILGDDDSDDDLEEEMDWGSHGAEVLEGDHAHARAFALTIFATEEVAKAYAATLVLSFHDDQEPSAWEAFWGIIYGHHEKKLQAALALEQGPLLAGKRDDLSSSLRDVVNEDVFQQRNRAIYVDVTHGAVQTPGEFAKDPDVTRLREELGRSMVTWAIILGGSLKNTLKGIRGTDPGFG